jgi:hypothetical protein
LIGWKFFLSIGIKFSPVIIPCVSVCRMVKMSVIDQYSPLRVLSKVSEYLLHRFEMIFSGGHRVAG